MVSNMGYSLLQKKFALFMAPQLAYYCTCIQYEIALKLRILYIKLPRKRAKMNYNMIQNILLNARIDEYISKLQYIFPWNH